MRKPSEGETPQKLLAVVKLWGNPGERRSPSVLGGGRRCAWSGRISRVM